MAFETIRKYLGYLYPVLTAWSGKATSLREITSDDIRHALKQRPGEPARDLATALRSLFRALKQERLIFRDPPGESPWRRSSACPCRSRPTGSAG